ncbi:hypothetical protein WG947_05645 [Pontibacter sp. H259]|uniref:hypothetical protein n=1 Tax=Pontibacter sp. H259 TaxID=3133421 RepID=UPI0030C5D2BB
MKVLIYIALLLCLTALDSFGQRIEKDSFKPADHKNIDYNIVSFTDFGISTFILIIPSDEQNRKDIMAFLKQQKGLEKYHVQFYIPDPQLGNVAGEVEKQDFTGLVKYLTGRKKLIDANLYMVAPENKMHIVKNYIALTHSGDEAYEKLHKPIAAFVLDKEFKMNNAYLINFLEENRNYNLRLLEGK